ncbi:MAG: ligase-associated DNA damage response DEXH box helicase [Hyphomicrobium sp.]
MSARRRTSAQTKHAATVRAAPAEDVLATLPPEFAAWFARRGWHPRPHQLALLDAAQKRCSTLLIAPTGAGKTLAGFLPTLVALCEAKRAKKGAGLRTLYISPLKALAADVARNLETPISEMRLKIRTETRSGDTTAGRKSRQRTHPPHILLTTPEQVALLLSHPDAHYLFADLDTIILDELHALAASKRGDLLALGIARLRQFAPNLMTIGLSATVARPTELRAYLVPQTTPETVLHLARLVTVQGGAKPDIRILDAEADIPWSGHTARYAMREVYDAIRNSRLALIFVNTRMQAEYVFQELWRGNDDNLPIGLHHGSLDAAQRKKVEAAMAAGALRAVVATSTLDLGIDWGDIDLVIHIGAPKGASRLLQRIGRSNHRLDEPSRAVLVPGNRFEVLECRAALQAAEAGAQDAMLSRTGALDVLCQHVLGMACHAPFSPDKLFNEVRSSLPFAELTRRHFDRAVEFVSTGGYALRAYERFAKLRREPDGMLRVSNAKVAQQYRLNVGTIVDTPMLKVRLISGKRGAKISALQGGRVLGEIDEYFVEQMPPRATFVFAGEVLRFEGLRETEVYVSRATASDPMIPSYGGGRFPMSTHLAERVRMMLADPTTWSALPGEVSHWLELQAERSVLPGPNDVLIETFPRQGRHYMVVYPFEGRLAHQTLGMLLTRRMDRAGLEPLGFVANDYALSIWCRGDISDAIARARLSLAQLFEQDMLGDDLDAWLAESSLMKRTFRLAAVIAGLIERRHPGKVKSGRQVTMSTDLIYDVLRRHDPGHLLLEAAWADAATGLLDIARLSEFLARIRGRIRHQPLTRVSPLSVPVLLEIGREQVYGQAQDSILRDAADILIREATGA